MENETRTGELIEALSARNGKKPYSTDKIPLELRALAVVQFKAILYSGNPALLNDSPLSKELRHQMITMLCILDPELFLENPELYKRIQQNYMLDIRDSAKKG